jgi:hypothetical protein
MLRLPGSRASVLPKRAAEPQAPRIRYEANHSWNPFCWLQPPPGWWSDERSLKLLGTPYGSPANTRCGCRTDHLSVLWDWFPTRPAVEDTLPLTGERIREQRTLPFLFLFHDHVHDALSDFVRHFRNVNRFASREFCFQLIEHEVVDAKTKGFVHRNTQHATPPSNADTYVWHMTHFMSLPWIIFTHCSEQKTGTRPGKMGERDTVFA